MMPGLEWNSYKVMEDLTEINRNLLKSAKAMAGVTELGTAPTPKELVYEEDKMKLYHYIPQTREVNPVPLLIVYALVNKQYMLDLQSDRSVIDSWLKLGLDVYVIDWGYPDRSDRYLTMEDYIEGYIDTAVDLIHDCSKQEKINLLGVCQGGTFSIIYSALHPEKVRNLITMVTPFDFSTDDGLLFSWGKKINIDSLVKSFGVVPGSLMNISFLMLKPFQLAMHKYIGLVEQGNDSNAIMDFLRMEKWIFDSPDQAGETLRKFVKDLYQENRLIKNQLQIGQKTVELKNITMPLLNIIAEQDHLVPPSSSKPINDAVASQDKRTILFPGGHIGLFVSSKSRKEVAPEVARWLLERSQTQIQEPAANKNSTKTKKRSKDF